MYEKIEILSGRREFVTAFSEELRSIGYDDFTGGGKT